jgi:hypothetical protein
MQAWRLIQPPFFVRGASRVAREPPLHGAPQAPPASENLSDLPPPLCMAQKMAAVLGAGEVL